MHNSMINCQQYDMSRIGKAKAWHWQQSTIAYVYIYLFIYLFWQSIYIYNVTSQYKITW